MHDLVGVMCAQGSCLEHAGKRKGHRSEPRAAERSQPNPDMFCTVYAAN